ncbi:MAG: hypothetical protein ACRC6V_09005 [Bacteroidales bacterium]
MKKIILVGIVGLSSMLGGCSTVMNGSSDNVTVMMNGTANCQANGKDFMAPSVITLDSSYQDVHIECDDEEGKRKGKTVVTSSVTTSAIVGNFFLGGIPGWVVDFATGNAFNYQPYVTVPMRRIAE